MSGRRYWIAVAHESHVADGVERGAALFRRGSGTDPAEMSAGDWFAFYSPRETLSDEAAVQAFTALGQLEDGEVEEVTGDEAGGWEAIRRTVTYHADGTRADIHPLLPDLSFVENESAWGAYFRRALFPIDKADMLIIARALGVDGRKL